MSGYHQGCGDAPGNRICCYAPEVFRFRAFSLKLAGPVQDGYCGIYLFSTFLCSNAPAKPERQWTRPATGWQSSGLRLSLGNSGLQISVRAACRRIRKRELERKPI
jgi:hypothetical protein